LKVMLQHYRNRWDLAAGLLVALVATIGLALLADAGRVPWWSVPLAVAAAFVARRFIGCGIAMDDAGLRDRRFWRRTEIDWDDVERFVIADRTGRVGDDTRGSWMLHAAMVDGRTVVLSTVRGRTRAAFGFTSRARLLAGELGTWHAMRAQLRSTTSPTLRPTLRLVSGA
jgi:hypothetical protein